MTTITDFSSFFFSSKNVLRHLASLMPLLRKEEGRMLRRTTDTCHIAGPTTVSSKIISFTSFGCFRGVYISFQLSYGGNIYTLWGQLGWPFLGLFWLLRAPFGSSTTIYDVTEEHEKGETCHCYLGFILLHSLISIIWWESFVVLSVVFDPKLSFARVYLALRFCEPNIRFKTNCWKYFAWKCIWTKMIFWIAKRKNMFSIHK